jgi:hypothetical protein
MYSDINSEIQTWLRRGGCVCNPPPKFNVSIFAKKAVGLCLRWTLGVSEDMHQIPDQKPWLGS